jgi:valyl-tRNA synthetase
MTFDKALDPKTVDAKWYAYWQEKKFFQADPRSKKPAYCIVMPPPNVTGVLHMGHALVNTIQDILIRFKRMSGFEALWIPGTDHAGISTQTIVERNLMALHNKKRKDFSREEFLSHVWKWKEDNEALILNQLKSLGCSCDWQRLRFTMDEGNNKAVRVIFKKLYDQGLIYRGDYLVNWDPVTQTAIADDEVEYEEQNTFLWHIKYPLADGGHIVVATTRPETLLGDTAVAVNQTDERYQKYIGKKIKLPLSDRLIDIIADHRIDPTFGTGAVKVTPAHDPNDYQMGLAHNLEMINILTPDGKINENGHRFAGLTVDEARKSVVEELKKQGLIEKQVPHVNRVGLSYRSKAVIQPYLSKQWFISMTQFKDKLHKAVAEDKVKLIPKTWQHTYFHWIDNLRDWCISRQLWWGHRIPIWYKVSNPQEMICFDGDGLPDIVEKEKGQWVQDEDVLDTWFSSALWPFSTLGWPDNTDELNKFYPNSVLVTGHDILFFWVARMILMGEFAMSEVPFKETFLHGLIYGKSYWRVLKDGSSIYVKADERLKYETGTQLPSDVESKWEKMSKTKGNVIDPIEMINVYGTDATRMALTASATQARQIDLDRRRFEEFKNFANKIWNGARFVFMNLFSDNPLTSSDLEKGIDKDLLNLEDKWILSKLNSTIKTVTDAINDYTFDKAALESYNFFWKEFCAYYVEIVKPVLFSKTGTKEERTNKQKILFVTLFSTIRLLHPIAPFITEELYQKLRQAFDTRPTHSSCPYMQEALNALKSQACITSLYPTVVLQEAISLEIEDTFNLIDQVVYAIRNIRGEMKLAPSMSTDIYLVTSNSKIKENSGIISALVPTKKIFITNQEPSLVFKGTCMIEDIKIHIPLPEEMQQQEKLRLQKEKEKQALQLKKIHDQLSNQAFIEKAPRPLVDKLEDQLKQTKESLNEIEKKLNELSSCSP